MLPFVLELVCARGVRVWLDGEAPEKSWSCGVDNSVLTTDELKIDNWDIERIEVLGQKHVVGDPSIGAYFVFDEAIVPETIKMSVTDKYDYQHQLRGRVTNVATGSSDGPKVVRMENGEDFEVDEFSLYIRAELTIIPWNPDNKDLKSVADL